MLSREARVGARWWADWMRREFITDYGQREPTNVLVMGMVDTLKRNAREVLTPEVILAYEQVLARRIQEMMDSRELFAAYELCCDYGPGQAHHEALKEVGVVSTRVMLPMQFCMWVVRDSVKVSRGYAAEIETLELVEPPPLV